MNNYVTVSHTFIGNSGGSKTILKLRGQLVNLGVEK